MSDNVYRKLQRCRAELRKKEIKESGNNKFAGYTYMELGDFLPHIVNLCDENGLCTVVSFTPEEATLTVVNSDAPEEKVVFTSPMSTAELKGCHAIQNLGAVETYLRRYLYVAAFDIVEHDALDATHGKESKTEPAARAPKPQNSPPKPSTPAAISDAQSHLKTELATMWNGDEEAMSDCLRQNSYYKKNDGKEGWLKLEDLDKANSHEGFQKWIGATLGKVRKEREALEKQEDDIPF